MAILNSNQQPIIGWRSLVVTQVVNAVDVDAQAFITAAAITDLAQASAINTLVNDLKSAGVWTKMKALYPMVGGTASSHKWNLKDPRDLDAAFRLVFNGGWTHSSTGALPNGTTGYADTKFIMNQVYASSVTNIHVSYYSRSNTNKYPMVGLQDDNVGNGSQIYIQDNGTSQYYSALNTDANGISINSSSQTIGYYLTSRTSLSSLKGYKNGIVVGSNTTTSTSANLKAQIPIYIGASNYRYNTQTIGYGNKESAFASIGDGLTDTEATNFYTAVQKYQTSLGRHVGTPILADGLTAKLLDTYSGAAAAYSLIKLRTAYTGNAITVRRSSDNTSQDIGFKVDGTLDTTALLSFVGVGNGYVTKWYDQSGNGYNFTQTTSNYQPTIVSSGVVVTKNGKPTVLFDGLSDYMFIPTSYFDNSFSFLHKIGQSFISFVGYNRIASGQVIISNNYGSSAFIGYSLYTNGAANITNFTTRGVSGQGTVANTSNTAPIPTNSLYLLNNETDNGNATASLRSKLYVNNGSSINLNNLTNTPSTSNASYNMAMGVAAGGGASYSYYDGGISQLIIWNSNQSSNRADLSTAINSQFSIY